MAKRSRVYWAIGFRQRFPRWRWLGWALVTAPLWLIGAFILVRDGLLHADYANTRILQFLPSFRWYWHWYVIAFLFYSFGVFLFVMPVANRITLTEERERSNRTIRRYQRMRQAQPQAAPIGIIAESNIEPYKLETILACKNERGFIVETSAEKATLRALVIPLKNKRHHRTLRRVGDIYNVSAEVSWVSWDGDTFSLKPGPAAWLSEERTELPFRRDDQPNRLILAITGVSDYSGLCAVQRQTATLGEAVREIPLTGKYWWIGLVLNAELETKPIGRYDFILERDGHMFWDYLESGKPNLIASGSWKSGLLTKKILIGYDLLKRLQEGEEVVDDHANWQTETAQFLRRNYEEKPTSKFLFEKHGTGTLARTPAQPGTLEERISRQISTLDELSKKGT